MNRSRRMAVLAPCLLACAAWTAPAAAAQSTTALDDYLAGLSTWSAQFTQTVTDGSGKRVPDGDETGRLIIVRPGKFRWESAPKDAPEAARLMVADGRNLWFYDQDLEQATVKAMDEALSQSPAMLLAGSVALREAFDVSPDGRRDGLEWVRAKPRNAESDFQEALFGFRGKELSRLVAVNKLGQRSTLEFKGVRRNATVDPKLVQFDPPDGVDVIGKPVPR
ncbi:MAG TPA: outer membrane lipoprotein chaperone LolA [Steroidobacteraceae bacterium]|nr:outer membrane lipoprotein chaperone LolA [Steroidobacteraceae bacterium]